MTYHVPVLVEEVLRAFRPLPAGTVLDATVGGGGHARAILDAFPEATLLGGDRDSEAMDAARRQLQGLEDRYRLVQAELDRVLEVASVPPASLAGVLIDLGVSSHQLDEDERGFAFRRGAPLDMRMDARRGPDAGAMIAAADAAELTRVFRDFGDVRRAGALARRIVHRRESQAVQTADDLVAALSATLDRAPSQREKAQVFQAIRIWVNDELGSLDRALPRLRDALVPGGTLVAIAYHSAEDRRLKSAFRDWSSSCVCPPGLPVCACRGRALGETIVRRPVRPSEQEIDRNPRARSARLRAWRRAA